MHYTTPIGCLFNILLGCLTLLGMTVADFHRLTSAAIAVAQGTIMQSNEAQRNDAQLDVATPVVQHPKSQEFPTVDGQRVVWQDFRTGPTDIFLADMTTNEVKNLTNTPTWEVQPDIDGDFVVWKDGYRGIGIHGLNLATGQTFAAVEDKHDVSRPHLSHGVVVWADNRAGGEDWNIYGYDIVRSVEFIISAQPGRQQDPQIDWPLVVWWDYKEHVFLYNLETKETQTILNTRAARFPAVSAADNLVVWQDGRNGNWDIYGYDLTTQVELALLTAPRDQELVAISHGLVAYQNRNEGNSWNVHLLLLADKRTFALDAQSSQQVQPALDGNTIVWQDYRAHQPDIYQFTWSGLMPAVVQYPVAAPANLLAGALPGGQIYLQWQDQANNESGFIVERAQGIFGITWQKIATLPANVHEYRDKPGVLEESYWYRVRAYNDAGYSGYSNETFNSTFADTPSPAEMYLMTLINEARADPAAFGYPAYPPVPPLLYNPLIGYSAHSHSLSILNSGFQFGHCDFIGRCPTERAGAVGYTETPGCAENLTTGNTGPTAMQGANRGFLDSEGHRNNMLAPDFREFGVGHTYDLAKGDAIWHGQFTEVFCGRAQVEILVLPTGSVTPFTGTVNTVFTYTVNFYSVQGFTPTQAQVVINGLAHDMTLSTGKPAHGTYRYATRLTTSGAHAYYFQFVYGNGLTARWPAAGTIPYPVITLN